MSVPQTVLWKKLYILKLQIWNTRLCKAVMYKRKSVIGKLISEALKKCPFSLKNKLAKSHSFLLSSIIIIKYAL